ncbi:MAG: RNase H family protein [Planctomycetota bacterium]
MKVPAPHYLLFSEAGFSEAGNADGSGRWRFLLRSTDGSEQFEAADVEPGVGGERLDLLTIVRALESLDQPSRVTLVGCSRHVRQGMQYGLGEWRDNGWRWECFGQLVPVKNGDLWQRVDRALRFHQVECCRRRFDPPHCPLTGPETVRGETGERNGSETRIRVSGRAGLRYRAWPPPVRRRRRFSRLLRRWRRRVLRSWTALKPNPWSGQGLSRRYVCELR